MLIGLATTALVLLSAVRPACAGPTRPPVPDFWWPIYHLWSVPFDAVPIGPAAFDSTTAYVGLRDGRVVAVSLLTGAVRWGARIGVTAPPAALEGLLIAIQGDTVLGLDGATGKLRWRQELGAPGLVAPSAGTKWIAVATAKPELIVLNPDGGAILWRQALVAPVRALPVGDADRIVIGLTNGEVVAFSATTGARQWTQKVGSTPLSLTLHKDRVFVGTSEGFLCVLATEGGRQKWRWRTGGDIGGTVAVDDKRVYFASLDNSLVALGRGGGDLKWEQRLPSRSIGGPVLIGNTLILTTIANELKTFNFERGTLLETVALPGRPLNPPHLAPWKGPVPPRAYLLTGGGLLFAMGPMVEPPDTKLDPMPGNLLLPPETLESFEPPLVPMVYPPGRLLMPESLPVTVIKKRPTARP